MNGTSIGLEVYKNPYCNQYVAPYGHHFIHNGQNLGRIIWTNNVEGIYIDKDETDTC